MSCFYTYSMFQDEVTISDLNNKIIISKNVFNQQSKELGFTIKSQLGGASTLLNAEKTTNFIYDIQNIKLSDCQIEKINQIDSSSKIKDRISEIDNLGGQLQFKTMEREIFKNNLTLIDSLLPNILAECLQIYFSTDLSSIKQITEKLEDTNPLQFDTTNKHKYYEYKIKRFLVDVALGMIPSKVWDGKYDATGGYLIVKEDGDIVCYHIYNKNDFENYLFNNTKFETASSTRHGFGLVEEIDGKQQFKLNLQIRFIK